MYKTVRGPLSKGDIYGAPDVPWIISFSNGFGMID